MFDDGFDAFAVGVAFQARDAQNRVIECGRLRRLRQCDPDLEGELRVAADDLLAQAADFDCPRLNTMKSLPGAGLATDAGGAMEIGSPGQFGAGTNSQDANGDFLPGHDQRLRAALERRVGGLLALRSLVTASEDYASGKETEQALTRTVRSILFRPVEK